TRARLHHRRRLTRTGTIIDRVGIATGHAIGATIVAAAGAAQPRKARRLPTPRASAHDVPRTTGQRKHDAQEPFHRSLLVARTNSSERSDGGRGRRPPKRLSSRARRQLGVAPRRCKPDDALRPPNLARITA